MYQVVEMNQSRFTAPFPILECVAFSGRRKRTAGRSVVSLSERARLFLSKQIDREMRTSFSPLVNSSGTLTCVSSSKNKELSAAPAIGPRAVCLFEFLEEDWVSVVKWLHDVDNTLPVAVLSNFKEETASLYDVINGVISKAPSSFGGDGKPHDKISEAEMPVVLFSGLTGEEVLGLVENWEEFTGIKRTNVAFGLVTEKMLGRPVGAVLDSLTLQSSKISVSGNAPPSSSQKFSLMTRDGKTTEISGKEELRSRLHQLMDTRNPRRKKSDGRSSTEDDDTLDMREVEKKWRKPRGPARGFG